MEAIEADGLTKRYGATIALDHLDLQVRTGEVFGFLGPNGAGKTTTVRLLLGLIKPSEGGATILGLDAWNDAKDAHRRLAYVPGEFPGWPALTGLETLELLANLHGAVDRNYRGELIDRFDFDPSKRTRAYSRGNRQKLILIAAFATRAELLLLDEPTTGLDPLMEVVFRECVREASARGQTVFLSSHMLSEVEATCDRAALLRAGHLVDVGTLEELGHLRAVHVEAVYSGKEPDVANLEGITVLEHEPGRLRLQASGSMDALLRALAPSEVTELTSERPSLEEVFLTYYERSPTPPR